MIRPHVEQPRAAERAVPHRLPRLEHEVAVGADVADRRDPHAAARRAASAARKCAPVPGHSGSAPGAGAGTCGIDMRVRVDEAGHQRPAREVEDRDAVGCRVASVADARDRRRPRSGRPRRSRTGAPVPSNSRAFVSHSGRPPAPGAASSAPRRAAAAPCAGHWRLAWNAGQPRDVERQPAAGARRGRPGCARAARRRIRDVGHAHGHRGEHGALLVDDRARTRCTARPRSPRGSRRTRRGARRRGSRAARRPSRSRRPVGVISARPPNSAATASAGQAARNTRPLADANAGERRPTQVCSRTGCVVSSIATKTDSVPVEDREADGLVVAAHQAGDGVAEAGDDRQVGGAAAQPDRAHARLVAALLVADRPARGRRGSRRCGAACSWAAAARAPGRPARDWPCATTSSMTLSAAWTPGDRPPCPLPGAGVAAEVGMAA